MIKPGGYAHWFGGPGGDREADTFTCAHCNKVVFVPPGLAGIDKVSGGCFKCGPGRPICLPCVALGRCTPFEKRIEEYEAKARQSEALAKML